MASKWFITLGACAWLLAASVQAQPVAGVTKNICKRAGELLVDQIAPGHMVQTNYFTCAIEGGPMNGAALSGMQIYDFKGASGTMVIGGGVVRMPGGLATYENIEGMTTLNIVDGKVAGANSAGKGRYKTGYGKGAGYSGRNYSYTASLTGPDTFILTVTTE